MRALAAALCLLGAAVCQPGPASGQSRDPCANGDFPRAACSGFNPDMGGYWHPLGRAAVKRLRDLPPRYANQIWYLVESFDARSPELVTLWRGPLVPSDGSAAKVWQARRYLITMADIARLVDEAPAGINQLSVADAEILARRLPVSEQMADERTCPAIGAAVDRLRPLMRLQLILPPKDSGSQVFDGVVVTVGAHGELVGNSAGVDITVRGNFDTPTTAWAYETGKALEPCWRPAPPTV